MSFAPMDNHATDAYTGVLEKRYVVAKAEETALEFALAQVEFLQRRFVTLAMERRQEIPGAEALELIFRGIVYKMSGMESGEHDPYVRNKLQEAAESLRHEYARQRAMSA